MIVIGITGGIASGKSTASSILKKEYNAYVFDADKEAKLLLSNQEVSEKIIQSFPDLKSTDPKEISKIVFKNEDNQKKLNNIVHPVLRVEMMKRIDKVRNQKKHPIFINDAALIIESGSYEYYHDSGAYLILLTTSESIRIKRALSRGNLSEKSIKERMELQWDDEKKKDYADYIIENNGSIDDLRSAIRFLIKEIKENAKIG
ncbi:MAG: dephospho-CoA kinase [Candidatus Neomarinimicrobiota bacterium]|nr:dephospho-CoA kinase [Candidatus Neomarinimicrobiota bacterium]|tara:strand:- start:2062 stop:2670 length:609 start_codon:yes stop_codon:yes gene_type:complete